MSNRRRTYTTAFGVSWGIFILVILLSIGAGVKNAVSKELTSISTNMGIIATSFTSKPYGGFGKGREWYLEHKDISHIKKIIPDIEYITPILRVNTSNSYYLNLYYGVKSIEASVLGVMGDYSGIVKYNINSGRFISEADHRNQRAVCVLGRKVAKSIFPSEEGAIGQTIRLGQKYYSIIGVVSDQTKIINIMGDVEETVFLPYSVAEAHQGQSNQIYMALISVKDGHKVQPTLDKIKNYLYTRHKIHPKDDIALETYDVSSAFQFFDLLLLCITTLIWVVGTGTIFSGIIGVSNILLVTVRERTREIGIRRALGGLPRDIIRQILLEGVSITLIAGLVGMVLAIGLMSIVDLAVSSISTPAFIPLRHPILPFGTALVTLLIIVVGGLLGGCLPAIRALSIKPIEAIREE